MKEPFSCKRDELVIRGHIYGHYESGQSAVILCHGFLSDESMCAPYGEYLARLGYLAVTFDFCGGGIHTRSDGKSEDMTVFTEMEDLKAVMTAIRNQFHVSDISLLGCSQGGFVSAMTAAQKKEEVKSLILFYPAVCIPDDARKGNMLFYRFDPENIPDLLGRMPMKLGGEYARSVICLDSFEACSGYDGNVLLVHGTNDKVVDISYARRLKDIYPNCVYREIEGAGHGFKGRYDRKAMEYLRQFMAKNQISSL